MGSLYVISCEYCKATQPNWFVYFVYSGLLSNLVTVNCDSDLTLVANRCHGHCSQHCLGPDPGSFDEAFALQAGGPRPQVSDARAVYQPVAHSPPSPHLNDLPTPDTEIDSSNRTMSDSHETTEH